MPHTRINETSTLRNDNEYKHNHPTDLGKHLTSGKCSRGNLHADESEKANSNVIQQNVFSKEIQKSITFDSSVVYAQKTMKC